MPAPTCSILLASVIGMEVARAVLDRLSRIEELERQGAPPRLLLAEVRALLHEAETWVRSEGGAANRAHAALERCRDVLAAATVPSCSSSPLS